MSEAVEGSPVADSLVSTLVALLVLPPACGFFDCAGAKVWPWALLPLGDPEDPAEWEQPPASAAMLVRARRAAKRDRRFRIMMGPKRARRAALRVG